MAIETVWVEEIESGDSIPGIDNAYVVDVDHDADLRTEYNTSITEGNVTITFHTASGEEGYLILPLGSLIDRKEK